MSGKRSAALSGLDWARGVLAELAAMPNVTLMPRTTVVGWFDGNVFGAVERVNDHVAAPDPYEPRQRYWKIIAKRAVLAAGAEERPVAFGGNDTPGVMLASAMRTYANRYAAAAGRSSWSSATMTTPIARRATSRRRASMWKPSSTAARSRRRMPRECRCSVDGWSRT